MLHGICRCGNVPRGYGIRVNLEGIHLPYSGARGRGPKTEALGK